MDDFEEKRESEDGYFTPFLHDAVADNSFDGLEPIVFNWGNVCDVDLIEEDKNILCPSKDRWKEMGYVFSKWLVHCPVHSEQMGNFKVLFFEVPKNQQLGKCPHCITDEINRVIRERTIRDEKLRKERRELDKANHRR